MKNLTKVFFFTAIGLLFFAGDFDEATQFGFTVLQDAEARIGNPLTPVSVAGVRRRTRRRTYRRAAVTTAAVVAPAAVVYGSTAVPSSTTYVEAAPAPATVVVEQAPVTFAIGTIISSLPTGCVSIVANGASYFSCNGTYLKPAFQGDKIVYMVVEQP